MSQPSDGPLTTGHVMHKCPACARDSRPGALFCDGCGAPLSAAGPAGDSAPALPATSPVAGRYRIERFLGQGTRKRVYLAHDVKLDRDVALALIKTEDLDQAGLTRVRREAQAMGRLGDHPHIVTVFDVGEENGKPFIVSQFMRGGDLTASIDAAGDHRLPLDDALRIAREVCGALAHAHARRIVHRDVKPGNVWLTESGTAKLGDFGLAAALDRSRITLEGTMVGTVAYMPPEQAVGGNFDARSDLYSLGALLYEMVTGRAPFVGDDPVAIISQHVHTVPLAPSWHRADVPPVLDDLVARLLAKDPDERPQSAEQVEELLAAVARSADPTGDEIRVEDTRMLGGVAPGVFVGREDETAQLRAALDKSLSGQGRLQMIAGEPGIGKTRMAEELATYAGLRGCQVLWGRCYEGEGAPAYWPWVQIIRSYVHDRDPQAVASEMGSGASVIAQFVSEVRERLPGLREPQALEPEQARFRLFDSITTFLKNAAGTRPLVLVLDDLHWADKSSLLLLQFLTREVQGFPVLVVGTYRDVGLDRSHPLSQVIADLRRARTYERLLLRGLSEGEVEKLIEHIAQHELDERGLALADAVHRETEGNPFFIQEILRHLAETHRIYRSDGRWVSDAAEIEDLGIPEGVREVIGHRLGRLSDDCNAVLTVAAVIGREFGLDALQRACAMAGEELLEALDEALAAVVLAEAPGPGIRYSFSHALIQETLYAELSTARRISIHRQVGDALEELYASDPDPHLAELAYHFLEAAPAGDLERAMNYATRAGVRAMTRVAYEEAAGHYERALQALELGGRQDAQRCALLLALGDAQWAAGEFDGAREAFSQAADLSGRLGAPEKLARAALGFGGTFAGYETGEVDETLVNLLERALDALDEGDSALRASVLGRLAEALTFSESRDFAAAVSHDAEAMARRMGDTEVLASVLANVHWVRWSPDNLEERLAIAREIVEICDAPADSALRAQGHLWHLSDLLELGDARAVRVELGAYSRLAEQIRQPYHLWLKLVVEAMLALMEARFEEAEQLAGEALETGSKAQNKNALLIFGSHLADLRRETGGLEELVDGLKDFIDAYPRLPGWPCALAQVYSELEREDDARRQFEALAANDFVDIPRDLFWITCMVLLAQTCSFIRDEPRAARLYELLLPYAERHAVISPVVSYFGPVSRYLALLAATMSRWDDAAAHFEHAISAAESMRASRTVARTEFEYARMLLDRGGPEDREKGLELTAKVLRTASETGMKMLVEKALSLKLEAQGVDKTLASSSIDAVAASVLAERPDLGRQAAPDGTVTILFSDIEESTALAERLGDRGWLELLKGHNAIVRRELQVHNGHEVQWLGDGFMLAFPSARSAVGFAMALQRSLVTFREQHPHEPIRVRIGIHTGEVIREGDDFFGRHVIFAARVAQHAQADEILVSSLLKELVESGGEFSFDDGRETVLKGLSGSHRLFAVEWQALGVREAIG